MLLKNATLNQNLGFDDVCKEKHVVIAYNNYPGVFEVSDITGEMVEYPVLPYMRYYSMAWDWEIQVAFFAYNNIKPQWFNNNYNWGTLNYSTGLWSGAVGMIQRDEADYAICCFAGTYARGKVAAPSPVLNFNAKYLLSRYPQELPPTWNLLGLFTKGYISQMSFLIYKPLK